MPPLPNLPEDIWDVIFSIRYKQDFNLVMEEINYINDCWTTMDYNRKDEKIIADTFWEAASYRFGL